MRLQADAVFIRTLALRHRFVLRSRFGYLHTEEFGRVPPDLRFFAGGDRSIRSYGYEKVSPEDSEGNLTGASKLLTGSAEYQFNVTGKWWGAVFFDAGSAAHSWSGDSLKKGAGVGVRWESPLGPIRLDVARPIGDSDESDFEIYIGLCPEL